jgi:DNA invertase Pin-like site-specific DNA recombinase
MIYGYARVSTQEQVSGTSLAEQARRIEGVAQALGLDAPEVVADAGVSGSVPLDLRPQAGPLLERLRRGDTLIVMKLDRAFRNAEDALVQARKLGDRGVDLIVADIGLEPIQRNGVGKLVFTILAGVAEMERDRLRERVTDGIRAKSVRGGYTGGKVPYGFRVEGHGKSAVLVPVPEEQEVVALIVEGRERGLSLRATAEFAGDRLGREVDWNVVRRVVDRWNREAME